MLVALNDAEAEYLVVGAYAMAAHGCPRSTGDIDFWVRATPENAQRVWNALSSFGAPMFQISVDELSTPDVVFQIGVAPRAKEKIPTSRPGLRRSLARIVVARLGFRLLEENCCATLV